MLIRDGATLVRDARDIIEVLSWSKAAPQDPPPAQSPPTRSLRETAALHSEILARLGPSPVAEDQLIRDLNVSASVVAPALVDLELDGQIARKPGGLLARIV